MVRPVGLRIPVVCTFTGEVTSSFWRRSCARFNRSRFPISPTIPPETAGERRTKKAMADGFCTPAGVTGPDVLTTTAPSVIEVPEFIVPPVAAVYDTVRVGVPLVFVIAEIVGVVSTEVRTPVSVSPTAIVLYTG
jgi:hypothetical protein